MLSYHTVVLHSFMFPFLVYLLLRTAASRLSKSAANRRASQAGT